MEKTIPPDPASGSWHLDKRVPIALIVAILVQTAVIASSYGSLLTRVEALERNGSTIAINSAADRERLVRIDTTVAGIDRRLERLEERR